MCRHGAQPLAPAKMPMDQGDKHVWILEAMTSIWLLQAVVVAMGLVAAVLRCYVPARRGRGPADTPRPAIGEALS
jgi:hypothetical protein